MNELERLREEARKRRAAVSSKISRIRRNTGVEIKGTEEDPREPPTKVKRMNRPQLRKYLNELNSFMARGNQYVAGDNGAPLPRREWLQYKRYEAEYNRIGAERYNAIKGKFIPSAGMTVEQRLATVHPTADGGFASRPYTEFNRRPDQIPSAKALRELRRDMQRRTGRAYLPKAINEAREQMRDMFDKIGHNELEQRAMELSDDQFDIVWHYTSMARQISLVYEIVKLMAKESADDIPKDSAYASIVEDAEDELGKLLDFGEAQPKRIDT